MRAESCPLVLVCVCRASQVCVVDLISVFLVEEVLCRAPEEVSDVAVGDSCADVDARLSEHVVEVVAGDIPKDGGRSHVLCDGSHVFLGGGDEITANGGGIL